MAGSQINLPNIITVSRIAACPAIFVLAISLSMGAQFAAFALFVLAGLSDLWDGYLARKHGLITDIGKLLDPLADKLLLLATFIPLYLVSQRGDAWHLPWWGALPMWVLIVVFGRELLITVFRQWAARRDVVIAAGKSGKYKAFIQNLFLGGALLWYPAQAFADGRAWDSSAWIWFEMFHGAWIGVTLAVALLLTVYSMIDYLWSYRALLASEG